MENLLYLPNIDIDNENLSKKEEYEEYIKEIVKQDVLEAILYALS
jgi:hypothetical protein